MEAFVTAGVDVRGWAARPGEGAEGVPEPGTINVVVAVPAALTDAALVNAVATATEAKVQALVESGYDCSGTPTDAVNLALSKLFPDGPPDLVISGINNGENLADDVTYSGTISAAMEGALAGIPAVAMSQALRDGGHGFDAAEGWAAKVLAPLLDLQMAKRTVVNVNFPPLPADQVKGIRVVRQGFHDYARGSLIEGTDPRGRPYFWFGLDDIEHTLDHGTDLEAVGDGYISVTPLQLDLTHHASIGTLAESYAE